MKTFAILPVKTFGAAKQRLSPAMDAAPRRALAEAMVADVLAALARVPELDATVVVTADPAARDGRAVRRSRGGGRRRAGRPVPGRGRRDSPRAGRRGHPGPARARGHAARRARGALEPAREHALARGGDRARPPRPGHQRAGAGPAGGAGAELRTRQLRAARGRGPRRRERSRGWSTLPGLLLDVDTGDDLATVAEALGAQRPGAAPRTRAALAERAASAGVSA